MANMIDNAFRIVVIFCALVSFQVLIPACKNPERREPTTASDVILQLHEDVDATYSEVVKHIPMGSSIEDARVTLGRLTDTYYFDTESETGRSYLHATIDRPKGAIVVRRWKITVYYDADGVSDISVVTGMVGP